MANWKWESHLCQSSKFFRFLKAPIKKIVHFILELRISSVPNNVNVTNILFYYSLSTSCFLILFISQILNFSFFLVFRRPYFISNLLYKYVTNEIQSPLFKLIFMLIAWSHQWFICVCLFYFYHSFIITRIPRFFLRTFIKAYGKKQNT